MLSMGPSATEQLGFQGEKERNKIKRKVGEREMEREESKFLGGAEGKRGQPAKD